MRSVRPLLTQGNGKLSASVWHFDIVPVASCPGRSALCVERCYAVRRRFTFPQVKERLAWAFEQSKRSDFVDRMIGELYRKGVMALRWHVAGDVYSPDYARKLLAIVKGSPHTRHWIYSRSWRISRIERVLCELAKQPNMAVWYSCDSETGLPAKLPPNVRVAWMQTEMDEEVPEGIDLLFLDMPLRRKIELPLAAPVCEQETVEGKARGVTCATCRVCLPQ